jgi:hypothetical protein
VWHGRSLIEPEFPLAPQQPHTIRFSENSDLKATETKLRFWPLHELAPAHWRHSSRLPVIDSGDDIRDFSRVLPFGLMCLINSVIRHMA